MAGTTGLLAINLPFDHDELGEIYIGVQLMPSMAFVQQSMPEEAFPAISLPAFPQSHELRITTVKGVYSWSASGISLIFMSSSEGVVAAKGSPSDRHLLAVADSELVTIFDLHRRKQERYSLRRNEQVITAGRKHYISYRSLHTVPDRAKYVHFTMTKQSTVCSSRQAFRTPFKYIQSRIE